MTIKFKNMFSKIKDTVLCNKSTDSVQDPRACRTIKISAFVSFLIAVSIVALNNIYFTPKVVKKAIYNDPQMIITSVEKMYKEKAEEANKESEKESKKLYFDIVSQVPAITKNQDAKIHVVELFDYNCGHCVSMAKELEKLNEKGTIKLHLVHYPILSQDSQVASYVALRVQAKYPKKYSEFHNKLFAGNAKQDKIKILLKQMGMSDLIYKDGQLFNKDDKNAIESLQKHFQFGQSMKVQGTPFVMIGNDEKIFEVVRGYASANTIEEIISKNQK